VDRAHQALEEMIVTLKLAPGSLWSEGALSDLTGIGRTPVREAIHRLSAAHLMKIVPRHGVLIAEVNIAEQLLVLELRRPLERLIATLAARRASTEERNRLPAMAAAMEDAGEAGDVIGYLRSLFVANAFLAQCARNPYAAEAIAPMHILSRRFYYVHHMKLNDVRAAGRLHADVARAVAVGDEQGAAAAADRMMDYVEEFTRRLIMGAYAAASPGPAAPDKPRTRGEAPTRPRNLRVSQR
jgi:DNA-binding GntR family transcriptional regulator